MYGISKRSIPIVDKANVKYISLDKAEDCSNVVVAWRTGTLSREAEDFVELIPGDTIDI
jgi:hypothetical protein